MLQKNSVLTVQVESMDGMMNGVAHADGQAVFIPGAIDGESVKIQIVKTDKKFAFGRIVEVLTPSSARVAPPCPYDRQCGGCSALHMTYEKSLEAKRAAVEQVLRRVGGISVPVPPVLPMEEPTHYRNKTAMPVSGTPPCAGFYAPRSHRLVPVKSCLVAMRPADDIAQTVLLWMAQYQIPAYDEATGEGLVRHILSRVSRKGESMAVLVTARPNLPHEKALVSMMTTRIKGLVSLCQSVNESGDNVILGRGYRVLFGAPRLMDTLCGFTFALSPLSFFQVNPTQTEKLYALALAFAAPEKDDLVFDLYCGAGTISLMLSRAAKKVVGVEIVPQAVLDAKENARQNKVTNAEFYAAAAETLLPELIEKGQRPDIIVLDPPRKGAERPVLDAILRAAPRRVVYVSCDPATLARDLKLLCAGGYRCEKVQPVDMFCWTQHVETVVLLSMGEIST